MIKDGLWDAFNGYHMGTTAENVAREWQITREEQDRFAVASQNKAEAARKSGRFKDEIAPVTVKSRKGDIVVENDEYIRDGATYEAVAGLKPAFAKDGTVTAGNASGINDGAAALIIGTKKAGEKAGKKPLARIVSAAVAGVAPRVMGLGPVPASEKALARAGLSLKDMDEIELNEAFASQVLGCLKMLGVGFDDDRVNPNGGAIAIGHPLGASGARLALTATRQLHRTGGRYALVTMCIGVGQGIAAVIERVA